MRFAILYVVILSMLLLFAVGCGKAPTDEGEIQVYEPTEEPEVVVEEESEPTEEPEVVVEEEPEAVEELEELELVLSSEERDKLEQRLTRSTEAIMSRPFTPALAPGDSTVLGLGITNTRSIPHDFNVRIELNEARTASGVSIQFVDEETVVGWFTNDFDEETYSLDDQEQGYYPLGIKVGDTINPEGDLVPAADFKFYVWVTYQEDNFNTEHERLDFTIKTAES